MCPRHDVIERQFLGPRLRTEAVKKSNQGDFSIERRPCRISIEVSQPDKMTLSRMILHNSMQLTPTLLNEKTPKKGFFSCMSLGLIFHNLDLNSRGRCMASHNLQK